MLGNPYKNDSFRNMGSYANNLYVLLDNDEEPPDISTRTFNIDLYEIR